jgi:hypothetical protein
MLVRPIRLAGWLRVPSARVSMSAWRRLVLVRCDERVDLAFAEKKPLVDAFEMLCFESSWRLSPGAMVTWGTRHVWPTNGERTFTMETGPSYPQPVML